MNSIYNKIIGFFCLVSLFTTIGCSEDYLEKEPSDDYLTGEQFDDLAKTDPNIIEGLVTGLYSYMAAADVGGVNTNEDFGQKANDIISDMVCSDMAYKDAYGRYTNIANLKGMDNYRVTMPHYMLWRYYYKIIYQANDVISKYGGNDATPDVDSKKHLLGQAKAMRAYAYLYLSMYYTIEYKEDEKVLVLYKEQSETANAQVSTKEIMELVVKDLKDAISLLETFDRKSDKSKVDKFVAKGLLTYAYAYMGQYAEVEKIAGEVIDSQKFTLTPKDRLYSGMNNIAEEEGWMWGVDIVPDMKLTLTSFWGQMDYYTYSYAAFGGHKKIDQLLYDQINEKDLRKKQFHAQALLPMNKFFSYMKPKRRGVGVSVEEDYVYMRVAEFYLLKAEAQAKLGNDAAAKETLKLLLNERYESEADYKSLLNKSGEELKKEIYLQTRIELWGEGKSYFAMKRNKATVKRGNNHTYLSGAEFQYNDPRLTFKMPKDEVENNPNIK